MMRRMIKKRIISLILAVAMAMSLLSGCSKGQQAEQTAPEIDAASIAETIIETLQETLETETEETKEDVVQEAREARVISTKWEDYVGDMETFVYGLLVHEMANKYNVFPAYVTLSTGDSVYGMGYTDYSECFADENEKECFFTAGIIPYCGELDLSEEEFDSGLIVHDQDYKDENTSFVLAYKSAPFTEHCVVYGNYLQYGVDDSGRAFYNSSPFTREKCDTSLGTLYSYDEGKIIYDDSFGEFVPVTGESLSRAIDYVALEEEINRILAEQDKNFASVDVESCAYYAQEAVTSYLLSLQEESFLGYRVKDLVELTKNLDPVECLQLNKDGISTVDLRNLPNDTPQQVAKWLVGAACFCTAACSLVASFVTAECPALSSASSTVMGVSVEIFMQVVVRNERLDNVDWNKVVLAAAAGAVSGLLGPYINATFSGVGYFLADSAVDGLIGGIEQIASGYLDGKSGAELAKSFGYGFAMGFVLSAGFKAVGKVIGTAASGIAGAGKKAAEAGKKMLPNLSKKTSAVLKALKDSKAGLFFASLGGGIVKLKTVLDSSRFHSRYIGNKLAEKQLMQIISQGDDELADKAFNALKKDGIMDADGNVISKEKLKEIFENADNDEVIGCFQIDGEVVNIKKQNGMVGIVFDEKKFQTVELDDFLTGDRNANFDAACRILIDKWKKNPELIPDGINEALKANGLSIDALSVDDPHQLVTIIQKSDYVLHENIDGKTVTLVLRSLHDKTNETGIPHMGGVALMNYVREHMGHLFFDRMVSAAKSGVIIAVGGQ